MHTYKKLKSQEAARFITQNERDRHSDLLLAARIQRTKGGEGGGGVGGEKFSYLEA